MGFLNDILSNILTSKSPTKIEKALKRLLHLLKTGEQGGRFVNEERLLEGLVLVTSQPGDEHRVCRELAIEAVRMIAR